jgi:CTP:molybdopterin cytidylyltransferase MocA
MANESLHVIVLAAGAATRFGGAKQLAKLDGQPLLRLMLNRAQELAGTSVSVVLGAHATEIAPLMSHTTASILINRNWSEGISSSIRLAIGRLPGACSGAMLVLADQAQVSANDLTQLASVWRRQPLLAAAASYAGGIGVPAIFPRTAFPSLLQLRGDRGAQAWLKAHADRVVAVPMPRAAVDIDTVEDLQRANEMALLEATSVPPQKEISGAEVAAVLEIESP